MYNVHHITIRPLQYSVVHLHAIDLLPTSLGSMAAGSCRLPPWVDSPLSARKWLAAMLPIMLHAVGVSRRAWHVPAYEAREACG